MDDSKSGKDGPMKEGEQVRARNTIKVILKKKKSPIRIKNYYL